MGDIISIDLGGTKLSIGTVRNGQLINQDTYSFDSKENSQESLRFIKQCIKRYLTRDIAGIAIGVPSIVDIERGIVFNAINIPCWRRINLKQEIESTFKVFAYINNDVNCFVAGEKHFGKGRAFRNIAGACIGTGFGVGVYIENKLYPGKNCGAGELGSVLYKNSSLDDYCSGKFFTSAFRQSGELLFQKAKNGDQWARECFRQFGTHLAQGVATILLAFDPEILILGGSVSKSYAYFIESTMESLSDFPYPQVLKNLIIEPSALDHAALLGAAALCKEVLINTPAEARQTKAENPLAAVELKIQ